MEMTRKLTITNDLGLHARSAAKIVALAARFKSQLFLIKEDQEVDAGNILSILSLACPKRTQIEARVVGEDASALMEALSRLFEQKFGEGQ